MNPSAPSQSTSFPSLELGPGKPPVLAPGASSGLGDSEVELHKMLLDERMRSENHKTNYQTLKAEHTRLQDEYSREQGEVKRDKQTQQEKLQLLLVELLDKTRGLEELRLQVMTPQRLDLLRAQVQQEMEAPFRERFNKLEEETEKYRSKYNKLRYDYTFLESQSEHQREESTRMMEEKTIRFQAEISGLEREKEDLVAQYQGLDPSRDSRRVEDLLREKAQLHLRLKGLEAEVAELCAQRVNTGQQAESVQRIQVQQLAESQAAITSLEAERQSVRLQLERMESELRLAHEHNAQLTGRLHKAERGVNALTCQVGDMRHAHKLELANVKLEFIRTKGEVERERDTLQGQVEGYFRLQDKIQLLKAKIAELELECSAARKLLEEQRVQSLEENHRLQEHNARLQQKYSQAKEKMQRAAGAQKKRKTLTENKEKRLRDKIQLLEGKIAELELDCSAARKREEEQANIRRWLKELQRRHNEFRHLLYQAPTGVGPAFATSPMVIPPRSRHEFLFLAHVTQEEQQQREPSLLHRRLDDLQNIQQHQLEELGEDSHSRTGTPLANPDL